MEEESQEDRKWFMMVEQLQMKVKVCSFLHLESIK